MKKSKPTSDQLLRLYGLLCLIPVSKLSLNSGMPEPEELEYKYCVSLADYERMKVKAEQSGYTAALQYLTCDPLEMCCDASKRWTVIEFACICQQLGWQFCEHSDDEVSAA